MRASGGQAVPSVIQKLQCGLGDTGIAAGYEKIRDAVDATAEAERLRSEQESLKEVVGSGNVLIRQKNTSKLPGL